MCVQQSVLCPICWEITLLPDNWQNVLVVGSNMDFSKEDSDGEIQSDNNKGTVREFKKLNLEEKATKAIESIELSKNVGLNHEKTALGHVKITEEGL